MLPVDQLFGWDGERIDTGRFLLPGLIDTHVHFCAWPYPDGQPVEACTHRLGGSSTEARNLSDAALAGVTTVRDLGGGTVVPYAVRRAWHQHVVAGARPLVAGPMITAVGGHGTERDVPFAVEVTGPDEARRAVRTAVAAGADAIKLVTSGVVSRTELTPAELVAATEEAHAWGGSRRGSRELRT